MDFREIIEGERKSEIMDEELKDVADKMADYADMEKSRLCKWVQIIGFTGVVLVALSIILQCIRYESKLGEGIAIAASFVALIAKAITTLYVNGILSKLTKKKAFNIFIKFSVLNLSFASESGKEIFEETLRLSSMKKSFLIVARNHLYEGDLIGRYLHSRG